MGKAMARARAAWGEAMPDWIVALAEACDAASQSRVAGRLSYSPAVINQVLKGVYPGDVWKVEMAVRGALMAETVACPVLGEIDTQRCLVEQRRPFAATSSLRVQVYRACRAGCPHSRLEESC